MPILREMRGANGDTTANASKGMVVKNPARTLEIPSPSRIEEITAPTPVNGVLSVLAKKIIAITKSNVEDVMGSLLLL